MDKLYIVIPAYNEEDNIVSVINDWYPVVEKIGNGSRLLIIDDGSRDSTYSIMKGQVKTGRPFCLLLSQIVDMVRLFYMDISMP